MTITEVPPTRARRRTPKPVAGPRFRAAVAARPGVGDKPHKLLCLLAAYSDAGVNDPPTQELARHLGQGATYRLVDKLLDRLVQSGSVTVHWAGDGDAKPGNRQGAQGERNRYELTIPLRRGDATLSPPRPGPASRAGSRPSAGPENRRSPSNQTKLGVQAKRSRQARKRRTGT